MSTWHEITCVTRTSHADPALQITHVGGPNPKGRGWRLTLDEAIEGMLSGRWAFFVMKGPQRLNLIVAVSHQGYRYIKSENDNSVPETLLKLPDCGF